MRYFTCQAQKLPILSVFTSFLILGKIQQDGDYVWWRHTPLAGPPPFKYIPHLVQKKKGVPSTPPPLPPPPPSAPFCTTVRGMIFTLLVYLFKRALRRLLIFRFLWVTLKWERHFFKGSALASKYLRLYYICGQFVLHLKASWQL